MWFSSLLVFPRSSPLMRHVFQWPTHRPTWDVAELLEEMKIVDFTETSDSNTQANHVECSLSLRRGYIDTRAVIWGRQNYEEIQSENYNLVRSTRNTGSNRPGVCILARKTPNVFHYLNLRSSRSKTEDLNISSSYMIHDGSSPPEESQNLMSIIAAM